MISLNLKKRKNDTYLNSDYDASEVAQIIDSVKKERQEIAERKTLNKTSIWDNCFGFLVPIWGIFVAFMNLYKYPKRSKSLFIATLLGVFIQSIILGVCFAFLFDYLGIWCIRLFG